MPNKELPFNQPIHPEDNQSINKAFDRNYGNRIKSGDTTPLKYTIKDGDGEPLDKQRLLAMDVTAILKYEDVVAYETEAIVTLEDETENYAGDLVARFTIQEALAPSATPYILEFHFEDGESSDRFIFPSANNLDIYITPSALNSDDKAIEKSSEQRLKEIVESSQTLTDVKTQEEERIANEEARQAKYIELVDTGIMQENINQKLSESEQTYAPRLTNLEQNDATLAAQSEEIYLELDNIRATLSALDPNGTSGELQQIKDDIARIETDLANITPGNYDQEIQQINDELTTINNALSTYETPSGAQEKADTAETNAKAYADSILTDAGGGVSSWKDLTDKPSTFTPSSHTHTMTEVNGLQDALDGLETTDGAQAKADAAEQNAKNYAASEAEYAPRLTSLEQNDADLTAQLAQKTRLTPDDFEGTDGEKLRQSILYAIENDIPDIDLTRTYDVTGETIDLDVPAPHFKVITLKGGKIIKHDSGFIFDSSMSAAERNSPLFEGTHFEGTYHNETVIFNGKKFIRQNMVKCYFDNIGLVQTDDYLQSIRLINCETAGISTDFIRGIKGYDIKISHHRGESTGKENVHFLNLVTDEPNAISYVGLEITNNLFEGFVAAAPIRIGGGHNLNISGNYFETNKGDIDLVNPVGSPDIAGVINSNSFNGVINAVKNDTHITFVDNNFNYNREHFEIAFNSSSSPEGVHITNKMVARASFNTNYKTMGNFSAEDTKYVRSKSYTNRQIEHDGHLRFEIDLPVVYGLASTQVRQFLLNVKFTFNNNPTYTGHLTGILSIDSALFGEQAIVSEAHIEVLSTRNTSGNQNGDLSNPVEFDYFFKESGNKKISNEEYNVTLVIDFPNADHHGTNTLILRSLTDVYQEGIEMY